MSMIAMAHPVPHSAFKREFAWDETRQSEYASRPRAEPERIELPSIRTVQLIMLCFAACECVLANNQCRPFPTFSAFGYRRRITPGRRRWLRAQPVYLEAA